MEARQTARERGSTVHGLISGRSMTISSSFSIDRSLTEIGQSFTPTSASRKSLSRSRS